MAACVQCAVSFEPIKSWQKFCSRRCKDKDYWSRHPEQRRISQRRRSARYYLKHPEKANLWQKQNREKAREATRRWRARNLELVRSTDAQRARQIRRNTPEEQKRNSEFKRHYGITLEQWAQMLLDQGGACALCREPFAATKGLRGPFVDHCHRTGKVRGLLCNGCNFILGFHKDSVERIQRILERAVEYLRCEE